MPKNESVTTDCEDDDTHFTALPIHILLHMKNEEVISFMEHRSDFIALGKLREKIDQIIKEVTK